MKPFDHNKFIGYICEVTPQYVRMQIPSARLLHSFYFNGEIYFGGSVGSFVVIEGQEYGFLGRIFEQSLPQGERAEITDKNINEKDTMFHPIAKIELLALFDVYKPEVINKTVSRYPSVGAKVYSCSDEQMGLYIARFGIKKDDIDIPLAPLGKLTSNDSLCNISLNSLFGRHCAVLGTTGGGKSWTIAKLLELISSKTSNKCILIDATGEYNCISDNMESIELGTGEFIFDYKNLSIDELYYLLHPSSKTQVPKLMEAIRSLKMVAIDDNSELSLYYKTDNTGKQIKGNIVKAGKEKRIVSLDDVVEAARQWSSPIPDHYHSRKRHDCPSSRIKFIEMAVEFLLYVGLLDSRYQDDIINYLAERKWHRVRLIAAPFYKERMSFLMDCKSKGFKRQTLQLYAQYQLHLIEYLDLKNFRIVTNEEISNAAKKWQNLEDKGSHKKKGTKSNYSFFIYFANMWLKELHMLPESGSPSISDIRINEYLNHLAYRRYSHAYIKGRRYILTYFYKIIEKENQEHPLTLEDIDKYIEYYTINKVQRNTLKEYLCCIRVYLRYAVEKGWCITDLDKALITPKVYSEENLPSFLPWNKVQKLLQTVKEQTGKSASRDYAIFMLLAMYGLRCSEVANLKISDIDWRKEQVYIKRAKNCRPQVLPLLHNVGEAIIAYLKQGRPNDIGSDNLFFCTPAPIRPISCTAIASVVYRYLKSSEMDVRHKGPHCLRHSHATFLINEGQTLKDVGDLLGHKSMEATRIYAKVDLNSLRDVSNINWGELL